MNLVKTTTIDITNEKKQFRQELRELLEKYNLVIEAEFAHFELPPSTNPKLGIWQKLSGECFLKVQGLKIDSGDIQ